MLFAAYYVFAVVVAALHVSGVLTRHNQLWLMELVVVTVFPAVLYL